MLHLRSITTASFTEHLKFKINDFYSCDLGSKWEIKIKKQDSEFLQGGSTKKEHRYFFPSAPRSLKIHEFYTCNFGR